MFHKPITRSAAPPENAEIVARTQERLDAMNLSAARACEKAGIGRDVIRDWVRKPGSSPTLRTIALLAEVLEVSAGWLAFGETSPPHGVPEVPVKGEVAAGLFRFVGNSDESHHPPTALPPDTRYPAKMQFDLIVRGTSINRIAEDGDYLRCVELDGHRAQEGDLVIVQQSNSDGAVEATAKLLRRGPEHTELWPASDDDRWTEPIVVPRDHRSTDREIKITARVLFVHRKVDDLVGALGLKTLRLSRRDDGGLKTRT